MRFLLTRRWLLLLLAVVLLASLAWRLGVWQFDRLDDRERRNAFTETNLSAEPAPVADVLAVGERLPEEREWRQVRAEGVYDAGATVVVRYQTRDSDPGVDLVTPLVLDDGTALLVDRGWIATENTGALPERLPAPPPGRVEVVGWARADATGRGIEVQGGTTRAVSSVEIGATLDRPVLAGFVQAESESPPPAVEPARAVPPDLGEGPHLFYGIQWWFFAALAVFGFGYLAWDERRGPGAGRRRRPAPAGTDRRRE